MKINIDELKYYENQARRIRISALTLTYKAKAPHIGSSLSVADILAVLYFRTMHIDTKNPKNPERDRFILSKGHAAAALYSTLALKGFFDEKLLETYSKNGSIFACHPLKEISGVEAATGSLGHGLGIATGFALAAKAKNKKYRTFVILGCGECQEGVIWENTLFAAQHKLDNLTIIVDYNMLQGLGMNKDILNLEPLNKKFESFGASTKIIDGHNLEKLAEILDMVPFENDKPNVIIAKTIKGKGVSFMENDYRWHYFNPTEEHYKKALEELLK